MATVKYEVDPISRIEGHLGVKVSVNDATGLITEANAHGNLWRGFENFLVGRRANDAITFTQRICGVCPVPHGTAATFAADSVMGASDGYATFAWDGVTSAQKGVPPAAVLVRNMVLGAEFLMSSITHFYHLAAQSYVQGPPVPPWTPYFDDSQYHTALKSGGRAVPSTATVGGHAGVPTDVWSAVIKQYVKALRIRRLTFEAGALFAGRMPMMSMAVAGGTTNRFRDRADFIAKVDAFRTAMEEVGRFVVSEYVPLTLALGALYPGFDNDQGVGAANLPGYGAGLGNFLAWGGFPSTDPDGDLAIKGGVKIGSGAVQDLLINRANLADAKAAVEANLKEFISRSRYANTYGYSAGVDSAYPGSVTRTEPNRVAGAAGSDKYSWMKAPRWNGNAMEVGPLARMVVNGKYLTDGSLLVDPDALAGTAPKTYANLYLNGAGTALDTTVIHYDLVNGLSANPAPAGGPLLVAVQNRILGLRGGLSTMDRLRARAIESLWMIIYLIGMPSKGADADAITFPATAGLLSTDPWVDQLKALWPVAGSQPSFYRDTTPPTGTVSGYGLVEAPRGALGHFITATSGKIKSYQCVVPTTWNGSPKDGPDSGVNAANTGTTKRGAMEQAMIGVPFDEAAVVATVGGNRKSGVEVLRVAQSFDPCIACAVH